MVCLLSSHSHSESLEGSDASNSAVNDKIKDSEWLNHFCEDTTLDVKVSIQYKPH